LEEVQVVKLRKTLINTAADTSKCDNINTLGVFFANPVDSLCKVGRLLISVVDDFRRGGLRRVEIADLWGERIEVANDELKVRL
jgi:hypothetical protein